MAIAFRGDLEDFAAQREHFGQRARCAAIELERDFRAAIENDPEIAKFLNAEQRAAAFSLDRQLRNVDKIFSRVFGAAGAAD